MDRSAVRPFSAESSAREKERNHMFNPKSKIARAACVAGLSLSLVGGVCAPAVQAFAADGSAHAVTLTSAQTHTYKLIKLFDGSFATGADGKLHMGDAKVSDDVVRTALRNALNSVAHNSKWPTASDQELADGIAAIPEEDLQYFANLVAGMNIAETGYVPLASSTAGYVVSTASGSDGTASLTAPSDGYYLIVSDPESVWGKTGESGTQAVMMPINKDTSVATKTSVPTVEKTIRDATGTANDGWDAEWNGFTDKGLRQEAGSQSLEELSFKITVELPDGISQFNDYPVTVHDVLPSFTTDDNTLRVLPSAHKLTDGDGNEFTINATPKIEGNEVIWDFGDVKQALRDNGVAPADMGKFRIETTYSGHVFHAGWVEGNGYTSIKELLGKESTLANPIVNTAYATYNPYTYSYVGDEANKTVEDQAKLYSYNLRINKVDEGADALKGAKFTLTQEGQLGDRGLEVTAADDGTFTFTGLDSNIEYVLTETQVPAGHKAIDPIKFKINATVDADGETVESITATETSDPSNAATFTVDDATVVATIVNLSGPEMPVTGMAGIAGGIVVGGVLIAVSGAKLAKKKADEE